MRALLARGNLEVLERLTSARVLLAFDFDGTLAPIVAQRDEARMRRETARAFRALCARYPCAVISGRGRADVARRLGGAAVKYVIGNHGLESGADLDDYALEMEDARRRLGSQLAGEKGVELEDKRYSIALHYRRARQKRTARARIMRAIAALPTPMRVVPGKLVVNMVPERAPDKGDALLALREREGADTALYVGDDVTDEDVFKLDQPGRLLTVRVGSSRTSSAAYFLRDQGEIDRLLGRLVSLRPRRAQP